MKNYYQKYKAQVILITILVVALCAGIGMYYFVAPNEPKKEAPKELAEIPTTQYTNTKFGYTVNYTNKWTAGKTTNLALNHSSGCTALADVVDMSQYQNTYTNALDEQSKTFLESDTRDIYIDTTHFKITSFQRRPQSQGETSIIAVSIPHFPNAESKQSLLLSKKDGSALSQECISDFETLLMNGIDLQGDPYTILYSSQGTITLNTSSYYLGGNVQWDKTRGTLVFTDTHKKETVLSYVDVYSYDPQSQLVGSDFYFISTTGQLSAFNFLTKQTRIIPLQGVSAVERFNLPQINDFFIYKDTIYYLAGENCNEYRATCNVTLRAYSLTTDLDTVLANNVAARDIIGFDTQSQKLYIEYWDGDAGCGWRQVYSYEFPTQLLNKEVDYSHCDGDPEDVEKSTFIADIQEKLQNQTKYLKNIVIKDGAVLPGSFLPRGAYGAIRYNNEL